MSKASEYVDLQRQAQSAPMPRWTNKRLPTIKRSGQVCHFEAWLNADGTLQAEGLLPMEHADAFITWLVETFGEDADE